MPVDDPKWIRYQARLRAQKAGIPFDDALEELENSPQYGKAEEWFECPECKIQVKGKNLEAHMKRCVPGKKISWNSIPLIKKQKEERRRVKGAAGKPETKILSGGLPSLGKKR